MRNRSSPNVALTNKNNTTYPILFDYSPYMFISKF